MKSTKYEVQEEVGVIAKRWKAVTYELDGLTQCWDILESHQKMLPHVNFRIVEIEKKETVVNLDDLKNKLRKN